MEERTIRLEERVGVIQDDIAEMKADYRRLDAKIDAARDSVSDVKDSVGELRVEMKDGFRAVDRQIFLVAGALGMLDGAVKESVGVLNGSLAALHTKVESLSSGMRETREDLRSETSRLSAKIDETRTAIDQRAADILTRMTESKASILETVDARFDRKFFRAISVFLGAVVFLPPTIVFAMKGTLGLAELTLIAAGASVAILAGTFLATRTKV